MVIRPEAADRIPSANQTRGVWERASRRRAEGPQKTELPSTGSSGLVRDLRIINSIRKHHRNDGGLWHCLAGGGGVPLLFFDEESGAIIGAASGEATV